VGCRWPCSGRPSSARAYTRPIQRLDRNVFYDSASAYDWGDLNETAFLERVIAELKTMMGDAFLEYAFFILSSHDGNVQPESVSDPSPRKVLIFVSDESASVPSYLQPHYLAIFKGYLPREIPGANVFPFNIGYVRDVPTYPFKRVRDRKITVFFSGSSSVKRLPLYRALHPLYRRLPEVVARRAFSMSSRRFGRWVFPTDLSRALPGSVLRFTDRFKAGLSPLEYGRKLADSRIVLCPSGGASPETFRHIEAMRAGAVLISEALPDTHFYRGAPILAVCDWNTGIEQARRLLDDEASLAELQRDTLDWWEAVCSEAATARYMRDRLRDVSARA
jgi:hypothetical protein